MYWLRDHSHVMQFPAHMRRVLPPFPFPSRESGPPPGPTRDPKLPAWGKPAESAASMPAQSIVPQQHYPPQPQGQHPVPQARVQPQEQELVQTQPQAQPQILHLKQPAAMTWHADLACSSDLAMIVRCTVKVADLHECSRGLQLCTRGGFS